jgi:V/A-type H+-transporting ATPase subunit D
MPEIKPTRSELIGLRRKIKLAKGGHSLLKRKRDGLIKEFFDVLEEAKKSSADLYRKHEQAKKAIGLARAVEGTLAVKSASHALKQRPAVEVKTRNVMGVVVPAITYEKVSKPFYDRGYGTIGTTAQLDEAAESYEEVLDSVIIAAEIETTLKKLLVEIDKTKRRVNALEFAVIPRLEKDAKFIQLRLEEMERENVFRLKRMKD